MAGQAHGLLQRLRGSGAWSAALHAEAQLLWAAADRARGADPEKASVMRRNV